MQDGEMTAENCDMHAAIINKETYTSLMLQASCSAKLTSCPRMEITALSFGYQRTTEPQQVQWHTAALGKGIKHEASPNGDLQRLTGIEIDARRRDNVKSTRSTACLPAAVANRIAVTSSPA